MSIKIITSTEDQKWVEGIIEENPNPNEVNLRIEASRFQNLIGFGGCFNELGKSGLDSLPEIESSFIMDKLFGEKSEHKFEFCRIPIGASDYALEWYSLNETDGDYEMNHFSIERDKKILIPYIKEALKRNPNLKLFASPWSPPTWMKHPKAYNYGTLVWTEENLRAYALYFVKFVQAYEAEGIIIDQIHVQNEVFADQKFPSCLWSPEQLSEFIGDYLGPAFEVNNMKSEIWLGTINGKLEDDGDFDYMAFKVLTDISAKKYIKGVSYQWFGKNSVVRNIESFPEIPVIQSENECGDGYNTWDYAKYVFKLMRHYLNSGVVAYTYWNMILNSKNGNSTWGWQQNALISIEDKEITYNHEYYVVKHLTNFVGAGSVRLGISGMFSSMATAFETKDKKLIIFIMNPIEKEFTLNLNAFGKSYSTKLISNSINTIIIEL